MKKTSTRPTPVISTKLTGFNDRIGIKRDLEDYISLSLTSFMKKCGYRHFTAPSIEQQQYFSSEFVGSHPWPGWHPKSLFSVTVKDYSAAYEIPPTSTTQCFLIPEVTASICRYVSNELCSKNPTLKKGIPFKVFYAQSCFRNELTSTISERKLREFTQVGLEFMGQEGIEVDLEVFSMAVESLMALGFQKKDILIRINDVRIFNALAAASKMGMDEQNELKSLLDSIASTRIKGETKETESLIQVFKATVQKKKLPEKLKKNWESLTQNSLSAEEILSTSLPEKQDLARLITFAKAIGLNAVIDLAVVRSQEYYNSIVFQIDILGGKHITAEVGGGGRYDYFVSKLLGKDTKQETLFPATGYAFSLERISMAMIYSGLMMSRSIEIPTSGIDYVIEATEKNLADSYKLASILRDKGYTAEIINTRTLAVTSSKYAQIQNSKLLPT